MTAPFSSSGGRDRLRRPTFGQPDPMRAHSPDLANVNFGPWVPIVQHPVTMLHSASWLKANLTAVPEQSGVYAFYLPAGAALLESPSSGQTSIDEAVPIYVGRTGDSLRRRLKQQLLGDARVSQLKANLGVLVQNTLGLSVRPIPGKRYYVFADERPLDDWIADNVIVGYRQTDDPTTTEAAWLASSPGLLNVLGRAETAVTKAIRSQRKLASGRHLPLPTRSPSERAVLRRRAERPDRRRRL